MYEESWSEQAHSLESTSDFSISSIYTHIAMTSVYTHSAMTSIYTHTAMTSMKLQDVISIYENSFSGNFEKMVGKAESE